MPPTLLDIAKKAETSASTVSRVLSGGDEAKRISEKTRKRVIAAAEALGYRPNLLARSLRTRRSNTVALMVSDIGNPFFGQIAGVVEQALRRHGYSLVLCNSGEDPGIEAEYLRLIPQKGIDGLILVPSSEGEAALKTLPPDLPVVILDRPVPGIAACVASNEEELTNSLCDTLEGVGVKRVAVVTGPQQVFTHRRRMEILESRFKVVASHAGPVQRETGRQAFIKFFDDADRAARIDAIVCTNNFLGQGFIDSLADADDPPIVGCFDELGGAYLLPVPLVLAMQDIPMLAEGCAEQMLALLRGGESAAAVKPIFVHSRVVTNRAFQRLYEKRRGTGEGGASEKRQG